MNRPSSQLFAARALVFVAVVLSGAATLSAAPSLFRVDSNEISTLRRDVPEGGRKHLSLPLADGKPASIDLERFEVLAPDAHIIHHTPQGDQELPLPKTRFYKGTVVGDPASLVYLAVDKEVHGLVIHHDRVFDVSTDKTLALMQQDSALVTEIDPLHDLPAGEFPYVCDTDHYQMQRPSRLNIASLSNAVKMQSLAASPTTTYLARLSIDIDDSLFAQLGNDVQTASNFALNLIGATATIYGRDLKTNLYLGTLHTYAQGTSPWTSPVANGTAAQLDQLGAYYHANRLAESRSTAVLLSARAFGGGIAWIGTTCTGDFAVNDPNVPNAYGGGYAFIGSMSTTVTTNPLSGAFWNLMSFAHELGHNFDSPHTHCIALTGTDATTYGRNFVDNCYSGEGGCYSGVPTLPA